MNGTEQRPLRGTATPSRAARSRPSTSIGEGQRSIGSAGSADRLPPASVPHGPALNISSGEHTLSSSIAISSDTASLSMEDSSSAVNAPAAAAATTAVAAADVLRTVPLPQWQDASSSLVAADPAATTGGAWSATATVTAAAAAATVPSVSSSSLLPREWRCSIDFSHEIETRAEAELHQLWTTLWCAVHSEAALTAALAGPRTHWNPYRPTRGGQEVREEVLNSEVAEFKEMIPTDSLYLHGTSMKLDERITHGPSLAAPKATSTTSPHRPAHRSKQMRGALAQGKENDEEVLLLDCSSVDLHPPSLLTLAGPLGKEAGAEARYTEAWWSAHRADGAAALLQYLWEAVVVPFYVSGPTSATSPSVVSTALGAGPTTNTSATLSPARAEEDRDEKDVSGTVTAFGPVREAKYNWALESGLRSSSPSGAQTPLSADEAKFGSNGNGRSSSPLARTQRLGCGLPLHSVHNHPDVVSDDSLEVEVLEDSDGPCRKTPNEGEHRTQLPARLNRDHTAGPLRVQPAQHHQRRHKRPSTAGVQAAVLSIVEDIPLRVPIPVSRNSAALPAKQRARSARTNDAPTPASRSTTASSVTTVSGSTRMTTDGRGWRWTKTPTLRTTATDSPVDVSLKAPMPKTTFATQQRPPTAQPVASRSGRVTSSSSSAHTSAAPPPSGGGDGGGGPVGSAADTTTATNNNGTATTTVARKTDESRSGTSAAPAEPKKAAQGSTLRSQRPPRQLNSGLNGSANRALQLLELRSRSTSRSPYVQRIPSPFTPTALPPPPHSLSSVGGAEGPRRRQRLRASPQLDETCKVSDAKVAQRRGRLSPVAAVVPPHEKHRRHVHLYGDDNRNKNSAPTHPRSAAPRAHHDARAGEEPRTTAPIAFTTDGSERVTPVARLAPLRETAAHFATPQTRPAVVSESVSGALALGRTPSAKLCRQEKRAQRVSSPEIKATVQRPTTAQP
jgi:hypothetical protein